MTLRVFLDYRPHELAQASVAVVERHPSTATSPPVPSSSRLEEVHERIRAAGGDSRAIRRLADGLSMRDVRGVARSIGRWDDVREEAVEIIRRRPAASHVRTLWMTWEEHPDVQEVVDACVEMGGQYGWSGIAAGPLERAAIGWLRSRTPGAAIQRWLAEQTLSYSDLPQLSGSPLRTGTPLTREVRDAVMTGGTVAQLRAEGTERLLKWLAQLSPENKIQFGRRYLGVFGPSGWDGRVLEAIKEKYGSPRQQKYEFFWSAVPDELRQAFIRWFLKQKLDQVFAGDTERHRYWSGYLDALEDIETGTAGGTHYAWLVFRAFSVVEFFEVGNAAYFYPNEEAERFRRRVPSDPSSLKERHLYKVGYRQVHNYLIHNQRWQARADAMIRVWSRL